MDVRRQQIASWIEDSVRPVANLIQQETDVSTRDEEIIETATKFEVREYQLDAWGALWEARQSGEKSGLIHLATGLGKTSVGVFDVIKFHEEFVKQEGLEPKVLFTCHKNEILEQAAERFDVFVPDLSQGFYNGDAKNRDAGITFATLQSLHDTLDTFNDDEFDYIIYDEAHHSQAETFSKVVQHFKPKFQLALTATPDRMDRQDIRDLFGQELYSKGLAEALADGWLAEPDYHIVFDDAVKEAMQSGFEANSLRALAELFDAAPRNEVIATNIKEEMARIGLEFGEVKTIVFCQNIEHAEEMAELLDGKAYHSGIKKDDRKETLHNFRHGNLQVITSRDMFNEGVDIPDARLLVFLRSTSSQTVFEQQLGRGLRKHAGKDRVSVLDFVANVERIAIIQELAQQIRDKQPRQTGGIAGAGEGDDTIIGELGLFSDDELGGFSIHTNHADFDFDRLAIDLLNKFNSMKRPDAPLASDGYYSMNSAYETFGVGAKLLERLASEAGLELPLRKFGPQTVKAISLQQIDQLKEQYPDAFAPPLPDEHFSVKGAAKELGVDFYTVKRIVDEYEWDLPRYKFKGGVVSGAIGRKKLEQIRKHPNITAKSKDATTAISLNVLSREVGMSPATVKDIAKEKGIELGEYRFGKGRTRGRGFSLAEAEIIKSAVIAPMPEEWLRPKDAAKELGIHYQSLIKIVDALGLELPQRKTKNGRLGNAVSPQQMQAIRESERYQLVITKKHWTQR